MSSDNQLCDLEYFTWRCVKFYKVGITEDHLLEMIPKEYKISRERWITLRNALIQNDVITFVDSLLRPNGDGEKYKCIGLMTAIMKKRSFFEAAFDRGERHIYREVKKILKDFDDISIHTFMNGKQICICNDKEENLIKAEEILNISIWKNYDIAYGTFGKGEL